MAHLLLVGDESNILKAICRMCWNEKIEPVLPELRITTFDSPFKAIAFATHHAIDLVVSDFRMPEMNGVAFLTRIRKLQPEAARIIVSAFADQYRLQRGTISAQELALRRLEAESPGITKVRRDEDGGVLLEM